ncbi:MAG: GTP-binding protein [Phycisphaerales bacterium]|nr:GTP-binding protein [Phycisphaerales bacterium]
MSLLRLITCGSVDDGKSTLIGRLLYDTKSIHQDQWEAVHRTSLKRGDARVDLALLTDGLRAEREQGITIDVAYRYFSTPRRKFILADTPGHVQYTRNMATGASTADLAIILIDARQGVLEQTRRHAFLATLLGVSHIVVAINKLDLVGWDKAREVFDRIKSEFEGFAAGLPPTDTVFIPISALNGDNIVNRSEHTPWYERADGGRGGGPTLLEHLEAVPPRPIKQFPHARFPVQWVVRPQSDDAANHDYRGYGGQIVAGELRTGDEVIALPAGQRSRVKRIHLLDEDLPECHPPQSVTVLLEHDLDISRGDTLIKAPGNGHADAMPRISREIEATVVWMSESPLTPGRRCIIKHGARYVRAIAGPIRERLEIHSLAWQAGASQLGLNEIGRVGFKLASTIVFDAYTQCRATGAVIVIDEATNNTVAAGMIL